MIISNKKVNKKVLVIDLDGTLYRINTFHFFIRYLLNFSLKKLHLKLLSTLLKTIFLRLLKIVNHSKMKFLILKAIKGYDEIDMEGFVFSLKEYRNQLQIIEDATFGIKILATAAPDCYAKIIALNEGFDVCLATNTPVGNYRNDFENVRNVKKQGVVHYLNSIEVNHLDTMVTDHYDDLPLMKISKQVVLVNPSKETKDILKRNQIFFNIV